MLEQTLEFLLGNACVNIRYIINRDLRRVSVDEPFMRCMQQEILDQRSIQKILASQHEDGWFGHELHGSPGNAMDASIGFLLARGVEPTNERLQKAKQALLDPEISSRHKSWFRGGDALDADGRGGNRAVVAGILAQLLEREDNPIISDEIDLSLRHFEGALKHDSIDDFSIVAANKAATRYYKPNALFPGANHIGLLAGTCGWRTDKHMAMVTASVERCIELMKDVSRSPMFRKVLPYGTNFVGPFNFDWHAFLVEHFERFSEESNRYGYAFWLGTVSRFPKLGAVMEIPGVRQAYLILAELLETDRLCTQLSDSAKIGYRRICAIEPSWRSKISKKCDIHFGAYTAVHNAGLCASGAKPGD
jgi:hypothetical protein